MYGSLGRSKRAIPVLFILIGLGTVALALTADLWGLSGRSGFGIKKLFVASIGLALLVKGVGSILSTNWPNGRDKHATPLSRKWAMLLGIINVSALAAQTVLSYGQAPLVPFGTGAPASDFYDRLAQSLSFMGRDVQAFVKGQSFLARPEAFLLSYSLPVLVSSVVFITLMVLLARHHLGLSTDSPKLLFRWAVVFAIVSTLASPVLVLDFWYPVGWGRMIAAGLNPYHADLLPQFTRDLPLGDVHNVRMMYGPLWAAAFGIVMWIAKGQAFVGAFVFKALLAGAWIASLRLVRLLSRGWSLWHQCVSILIFGWLPLSVMQAVAEGHNDMFMVMFLLLWLYNLERGRDRRATVALAASVLIKYVSAPLLCLDVMHMLFTRRRRITDYLPQLSIAGALVVVMLALFYRSPDFFDYFAVTLQWHFFTLSEAAIAAELLVVGTSLPFGELPRALFLLVPGYFVLRYIRQPGGAAFRYAAVAVMAAMLFSVSSHVWPWYLLWVVALAALVPGSTLARWIVGVTLAMPFVILVWIVYPNVDAFLVFDIPALALYTFAAIWLGVAPRRWFPESEARARQWPVFETTGISEQKASSHT